MNVPNKKIIRKLTMRFLVAGKVRNIIAVIAIVLTSVMFTSVFTIAGNMLATFQNETMRMVGTSAHGGLQFLTMEQYENFAGSPLLRDISSRKALGVAENELLHRQYTEISYAEDNIARWKSAFPTNGRMPFAWGEIATSTLVLDALGISHQLGAEVPIEFTVSGRQYSEIFTLVGYWTGDPMKPAQHVWLSREFVENVAPIFDPENDFAAGSIHADVWFSNSFNIQSQMEQLVAERGYEIGEINIGVNWAYAFSGDVDIATVGILILALVLILLSGYLIIYSVFAISVKADIHFYGLLKTIGTTGKQLKRIVRGQALILSVLGVPVGLLLGYFCGVLLTPALLGITGDNMMVFVNSTNPMIFVFAGVFSLLTVLSGCRKPGKIAARVSPVEAVKFSGISGEMKKKSRKTRTVTPLSMAWANVAREKRKLCIVVLSLSLSLILLNSAFSASRSFDAEVYLKEMAISDFAVADAALYNNMTVHAQANKITPDFLAELAELGVADKGVVFHYANMEHQLSPVMREIFAAFFDASREDLQRNWRWAIPAYEQALSDGRLPIKIYGFGQLPLESFSHEYERLSSGNYALIRSASVYAVGDTIMLTNEAGQTREFEIIAVVGDIPVSVSSRHTFMPGQTVMLADNIFTEFFTPSGAMQVHFNVEPERLDEIEEWLIEYTAVINRGLGYISRNTLMAEFEGLQTRYILMGGVMSAILALVGILNFINAVVASIIARHREFAMLQSVGMTGKQLRQTLFFEGIFYTALTAIFTLTAGLGIGWLIVRVIAGQTWFFEQSFTVLPSMLSLAPLLIICAVVPFVCYAKLNRNSLVERLRVE